MTHKMDIRIDEGQRQVQSWIADKKVGNITVPHIDFDWGRRTIIPMAGIAAVGVDEACRGKGIASRMMQGAVEYARDNNYPIGGVSTNYGNVARRLYTGHDFTFLFSIDFYTKDIGAPDPAPSPAGVEIRPYVSGDVDGIIELWNSVYSDAGFFGSRKWQREHWLEQREDTDSENLWIAVRENRIVGWAEHFKRWSARRSMEMVVEDCEDHKQICKALHTRVERAAYKDGITDLTADASYHQSRLVETLFDVGYSRANRYVFQVAIFDLSNLLARLKPLFDKELQASEFDSWPGVLRVEMDDSMAEIELEGGRKNSTICISGGYQAIVRMLCGRVSAWQGFLRNDLKITGDFDVSHQTLLNAYLGQRPWQHPARYRW